MGIFKRLLGVADRVDNAVDNAELALFRDRRFARADALAASGASDEAVVTGIHRRHQGDSGTETRLRLEWYDPEPRVGGVLLGDELPLAIRLGSTVAIRSTGGHVALDHAAMPGAGAERGAPQRTLPSPPEQGVDDRALDARVLKAIAGWAVEDATVESIQRVTLMGMDTLNWDLGLRRADGTTSTVKRDEVPSYCRWFVAPGATLPIRVDPSDPTRARVDWPELAERMATSGGRWQDQPPPGSIASLQVQPGAPETAPPSSISTTTSPGEPLDSPAPSSVAAVEGVTIQQWAYVDAALTRARVKPADHDMHATEHHGIPAGRWSAIKQQWESRQMADWRVGAAFGEAYEAARKELKKRPR